MRGVWAGAAIVVGAVVGNGAAYAQVDCILDPNAPGCEATTTTEAPTTTSTTDAPATTTTARPTTTAVDAGAPVDTTLVPSSTTSLPALLEEGPPVEVAVPGAPAQETTTTTTAPVVDEGGDDDTGRQVFLIVTGLLVLAVVFALMTYWYWRRTRPVKPKATAKETAKAS